MRYCIDDCAAWQISQKRSCKVKNHIKRAQELSQSTSSKSRAGSTPLHVADTGIDQTGRVADRDAWYDGSKPLAPEHYDAQKRAEDAYVTRSTRVAEQKAAEESAKKNLSLVVWAEEGRLAKRLSLRCSNWPFFVLGDCPLSVRQTLGLPADIDVVETYVVGSHQWEAQTMDFSRDVSDSDILLYRICGVGDGISMSQEILSISYQGKPKKRPANFGDLTLSPARSIRPRITPLTYGILPKTPHQPPCLTDHSSTVTPALSTGSDSPAASPLLISSSDLDSVSDPFTMAACAEVGGVSRRLSPASGPPLPSAVPCQSKPEIIDLTEDSLEPTSKRSLWPLRSLKAMEKGFQKLDGLGGTLQQRFRVAFPNCGEHVKEDIEKANGLWKNLVQVVERRLSLEKTSIKACEITSQQDSTALTIHTCSYCSGQFPARPSTPLLYLQRSLLSGSTQSSSATLTFCIRHALEARYERQTPPWPMEINWADLGPRVEALRSKLEVIWSNPMNSEFYDSALSIHRRGAREVIGSGSSGYFGEKGAAIMGTVIRFLFDHGPAGMISSGLSIPDLVLHIMIPETALLLAQQDLGLNREAAARILKMSKQYGDIFHQDDDADEDLPYSLALVQRASIARADETPSSTQSSCITSQPSSPA
ncbi:hypothetical protein PUNSTDRAFT_138587 [Punctularia strigosozonata HHB-11173 SS5]|uniref:Restriction of telomere capping protein 4 n=1 Tax=Punctularia strigosozonata (strain HHB-11173) TaxID=741275 RepID=R7S2B8_PUNST|nr:uncharacterized protein PUNSTDRAFT_138587 [Punctularia strigosozonata HHB-11173 SS5]EIN04545.1 hypothetical protein PUNSTDRAFT_138587 [Punctularia strigosozonata HHB-11173 SS5]